MENKNVLSDIFEGILNSSKDSNNGSGFNTEELTKLVVCGGGALGCFAQTGDVTVPNFLINTLTTISNLTLPQIAMGMIVGLGSAILTSEVIQSIIENKEEK